ncbi:HAD-like protein [Guyanagaster necrorhizus]|uniref:HAD-like protein n=1 Tax=Guyanagaster necrorhizus TaxID=856835 RepID=A0A9P7VKH9_9AGAR|nr:HAD-like protein [Guyanagaster necrorhizus MCA 3950]KAG7442307.1 HAD-like protein [Guyanagaster necrorhizus MCA 3950]
MARYNAIICDLGDVLFTWSPPPNQILPLNTLRRVLSSSTWFEYEKGRISQQTCYDNIGRELSTSPMDIRKGIEGSCASLRCNLDLVSFFRELKDTTEGGLRIFAMSNISQPDYDALRSITVDMDWSIFDGIFTSFAAGTRKPELKFYRYALSQASLDPSRTIFIDDRLENVLSARSQGLHGLMYRESKELKQSLLSLFGDPILRGQRFLKKNAGHLASMCSGIAIQENFTQLLILEMTKDRSLIELGIVEKEGKWNFFRGNQLTTAKFPCDLDTTSLGLTVIRARVKVAASIMDEMLNYINEDGIIQTYFDHDRPRIDPVVCVNVLHLFYSYGRGNEISQTFRWVHEVLLHRAYVQGSRYYETAECFLFFLYRFISGCDDPVVHTRFYPLLKERITERIGAAGDGLALAMRLVVCHFTGVRNSIDLQTLRAFQCEDGGWDAGLIYKYGSSGLSIGNRGLTTAMAIHAIRCSSLASSSL